jgi:hypothetical protein
MADPKGEKAATVVDGVDVHAKKTTNVAIEDLSVSLGVRLTKTDWFVSSKKIKVWFPNNRNRNTNFQKESQSFS